MIFIFSISILEAEKNNYEILLKAQKSITIRVPFLIVSSRKYLVGDWKNLLKIAKAFYHFY